MRGLAFKRPSRRLLLRVMLVSGLAWLLVILALGLMIHSYGQDSQAQPADVIVVLGSGLRRDGSPGDALRRRSIWAAQAYADGYAPRVICTGGQSEGQRRSEAEACRELLLDRGVPDSAIFLESQSRSTEENALYTAQIMAAQGFRDAVLITDSFHMLRADWLFDMAGITHYPHPVPSDWVRSPWYTQLLTREIAALHWQVFKDALNLPHTHLSIG